MEKYLPSATRSSSFPIPPTSLSLHFLHPCPRVIVILILETRSLPPIDPLIFHSIVRESCCFDLESDSVLPFQGSSTPLGAFDATPHSRPLSPITNRHSAHVAPRVPLALNDGRPRSAAEKQRANRKKKENKNRAARERGLIRSRARRAYLFFNRTSPFLV